MENKRSSDLACCIQDETFEMNHEEIRKIGYQTVDLIADYFRDLQDGLILPQNTFKQIQELIDEPLPQNEQDPHRVIEECQKKIVANTVRIGHPRLVGWMLASGTTISAFADGIADALNQNVAVSGSAAATTVELLVLDWIKQILGYDANAAGLLVSGGSVANLTALMVARNVKADFDVRVQGMAQNDTKNMMLYASEEVHLCVPKAAHILGIGMNNIRWVQVDNNYRLDSEDLKKKIIEDRTSGKHPFCVVATAGTVNTGAIDPLESIADICQDYGLWFHVDAAYGGFAALSDTLKPGLRGIERADSIVLDPHKWLFIPFEAGCVLIKNPLHMRQTFIMDAPYIHTEKNASLSDLEIDFSDYGIQLSRQFRALKIWMSLKQYGVKKYQRLIDQNVFLAQYLDALVKESNDFEVVAPVGLSTVCFRYYPEELQQRYQKANDHEKGRIEEYLNMLNRAIIEGMRADGRAVLSGTILGKKFVLRACIMNYRTRKQDITMIMDVIRDVGSREDIKIRNTFL